MKISKLTSLILILLIIGSISLIQFSAYPSKNNNNIQDYKNNDKDVLPPIRTASNNYFSYHKIITIDHTKVNGTSSHENFPLLIDIYDADLHNHTQSTGNDIAFSDGVEWLDHEIEHFNQSYSSTHAHLVAWVRIPSLSTSYDTKIYMYYGNETMESQENPSGVWDDDYVGVWHLKETPIGEQGEILDSTQYANNGTSYGSMDSNDQVEAQINGGINFEGNDNRLNISDDDSLDITNAITIEAWAYYKGWDSSLQQYAKILVKPTQSGGNPWNMFSLGLSTTPGYGGDQYPRFEITTGISDSMVALESTTVMPINTWTHIAGVYDGSNMYLFINGISEDQTSASITIGTNDQPIQIGSWNQSVDNRWNGIIDEVRLSNVSRSADCIATEYNNQYDPNSFYSIGKEYNVTEHPPNVENFTYYKELTINHTKVNGSESLINFPALISIVDSDLHDHAQPDGDDLAFGINNAWLDHEIELFNQSYSDTHAQLIVWVRIPSLSTDSDTKIHMYYGNSTMIAQENPIGVWNSNYGAVWHLNEAPNDGTIGGHQDSTTNNNDGTPQNFQDGGGGSTNVIGKIDGAVNCSGDDDYITIPSPTNTDPINKLTVSAWIKVNDSISHSEEIVSRGDVYAIRVYPDGNVCFIKYISGTTWEYLVPTGVNIIDNEFHYIVAGQNASGMFLFVDGFRKGTNTNTTSFNYILGDTIEISRHGAGSGNYNFSGIIDEVRISNIGHSADWIATEYNNQYDPNSFYNVGTEKTIYDEPSNVYQFRYYKVITIDHTKVFGSGCHINFPLLISMLDEDLHDYAQPDGDNIAFTQGNKWLDHEIEQFNQSYSDTEAKLIVWVKVPFLSTSIDTNIIMYFGNITNMNSRENPTGVWDTNYKGVWHLKENPEDPDPQFKDSTENDNDGTQGNLDSSNQGEGKIDGGLSFEGSSDSNEMHFNVSHSSSLQLNADITISSWIKTNDTDTNVEIVLAKWGSTSDNQNYWLGKLDENNFLFFVDDNTKSVSMDLSLITDGQWHYVVAVADSTNGYLKLYLDGVEKSSNSYSGITSAGTSILSVGRSPGTIMQEWNGTLDEIRISNVIRSSSWIATKYNNTQDPNNFYSLGTTQKVDTTPPSWTNLVESEDILELGDTEIILIDVFDLSGINQILIEINELNNYTMEYVSGNTWCNNSWTPAFTGKHNYTIYMEDNHNNWNSTSGDIFVQDNTPPSWSNLGESEEFLELGDTEIISIDVSDLSGINQVLIEINELTNYSMEYVSGNTWHNNSWTPTFAGKHNFTIYIEDKHNNWNSTSDSIQVVDTTGPMWFNLIYTKTIEKDSTETIMIDVTDLSDVSQVLFEIDNKNYTMVNIGGNTWQNDTWTPSETGIYYFTIYMNDTYGNWNLTTDSISVIDSSDTTPPTWENLQINENPLELGNNEIISIDVFDDLGILEVIFEIELGPININFTMVNISANKWQNDTWTPLDTGDYDYTIHIRDIGNNWNTTACGIIQVQDTIKPEYSDLEESADPLTLGNIENITILITDISGIEQVLIEIGGINYSMRNIAGTDMWCNDSWTPTTTGYHTYTIYMKDYNNNWNSVSEQIFVISATPPPSDGGGGGGGGGSSSSSGDSDFLPMILVIIGGSVGALIGIIIFIKKRSGEPREKELETIESIID